MVSDPVDFSAEQNLLREAAREFARDVVAPRVKEMEETEAMPPEIVRAMGERGLFAVTVPREYGGLGLGQTERLIVVEEVSRVSVAVGMFLQVSGLPIEAISRFGTPEQKAAYLPDLAKGAKLGALAVTESGGGSDPASGTTAATAADGGFSITGRKVFITNAPKADVAVILARTGEQEMSAFIVERGIPGFRPGHLEHKVGMKGCDMGDLVFEDCRVPEGNLLGPRGSGLKVMLGAIGVSGRLGMAGCGLGLLWSCLDLSVRFAKERQLYGKPIAGLQLVQDRIATMSMDLAAARLLAYRAAALADQGRRCDPEVATAKYFSTEAAMRAAKSTCDLHGGYGTVMSLEPQRLYRDAIVLGASAGASDVMKVIVARAALA